MEVIKIGCTDIFLEDKGEGTGKITISDTCRDYNFSYYWGAMGSDLKTFLKQINPGYFSNKLAVGNGQVFSAEASVESVRTYLKEEVDLDKDFFPSAQEELYGKLDEIEASADNGNHFVDLMLAIKNEMIFYDLTYREEDEFMEAIQGIFETPWYFIETKESNEVKWLEELLPKIQEKL